MRRPQSAVLQLRWRDVKREGEIIRPLGNGSGSGSIPFRKAYLQSLIDVIEVNDPQIRIRGSKDVLERPFRPAGTGLFRVRR